MIRRNSFLMSMPLILLLTLFPSPTASAHTLHGCHRIAGMDRYETCIRISMAGWPVSSQEQAASKIAEGIVEFFIRRSN